MDPITAAIVAALAAGAISGLTETSKAALTDAYQSLKDLLAKKFGARSQVVQAVDQLEAKPDSAGRKETLQEEIIAVKANQDQEIRQAAQALLDYLKALPGGEQHIQQATGSYIAQADRGSTASVTIHDDRDKTTNV